MNSFIEMTKSIHSSSIDQLALEELNSEDVRKQVIVNLSEHSSFIVSSYFLTKYISMKGSITNKTQTASIS